MSLKHPDYHPTSSREAEPPPDPPGLVGTVTLRMGETSGPVSTKDISSLEGRDFWPESSTSWRQVVAVPLAGSDEFVIFGIFPAALEHTNCCRMPFVARVKGENELDAFFLKLATSGAEGLRYDTAPLKCMQDCMDKIGTSSQQQVVLAAMDWNRTPATRMAALSLRPGGGYRSERR